MLSFFVISCSSCRCLRYQTEEKDPFDIGIPTDRFDDLASATSMVQSLGTDGPDALSIKYYRKWKKQSGRKYKFIPKDTEIIRFNRWIEHSKNFEWCLKNYPEHVYVKDWKNALEKMESLQKAFEDQFK